ncbi:MAG: DUF58 domain-containing protein [Pseudomonadota bacterium]
MAALSDAQLKCLPKADLRHRLMSYALTPGLQVDNAIHATHRSVKRDSGVEFSQYRAFQPGDDLRRVDWRVYGRSDRLLVRESQSEGRLTVALVVDLSGSMGMRDDQGVSRWVFATRMLGALAWLAVEQHHDLVLVGLNVSPSVLPAAGGRAQLERFVRTLDAIEPGGEWPAGPAASEAMSFVPNRSAVFSFSDHLSADDGMESVLTQLSARGCAVTSTQILLPQEVDPPTRGQYRVLDCESGASRWFDASSEARDYQRRFRQLLKACRHRRVQTGARFVRTGTDQALDETLHAILSDSLSGRKRLLVATESM